MGGTVGVGDTGCGVVGDKGSVVVGGTVGGTVCGTVCGTVGGTVGVVGGTVSGVVGHTAREGLAQKRVKWENQTKQNVEVAVQYVLSHPTGNTSNEI